MPHRFDPLLRGLNLKSTPKRRAILDILAAAGGYASPEEVWQQLKVRFARIGLPTVYRNLEELAAKGVVSTIHHPNRQLYYYLCRSRCHHHHFVCLACRRVEELEFCAIGQIEEAVTGRVDSHIIQANGLCRECLVQEAHGVRS